MALEHHRFFGTDIQPYLPLIRNSVRFFDEHYQLRQKMRSGQALDANGKLVIFPSTSCESSRGARNPTDLIAGLHACLDELLALDDKLVPPAEKDYYRGFKERVPPYTYGETNGTRVLLPAESYKRQQNFECPQFYPLFPFNQFALGRDDMTVFKDTWKTSSSACLLARTRSAPPKSDTAPRRSATLAPSRCAPANPSNGTRSEKPSPAPQSIRHYHFHVAPHRHFRLTAGWLGESGSRLPQSKDSPIRCKFHAANPYLLSITKHSPHRIPMTKPAILHAAF